MRAAVASSIGSAASVEAIVRGLSHLRSTFAKAAEIALNLLRLDSFPFSQEHQAIVNDRKIPLVDHVFSLLVPSAKPVPSVAL
jgi:hypothetical protein